MKERVGLHLRVSSTLSEVAAQAINYHVPFFQCFLLTQEGGKPVTATQEEIELFRERTAHTNSLFVHGSYWINLSRKDNVRAIKTFKKELRLAQQFGFDYFIVHPGSATGFDDTHDRIQTLARALDDVLHEIDGISVLLENTAHGNKSVGSSLEDLRLIRQTVQCSDRIGFCIDTAHAFAYGYNIKDCDKQDEFIAMLDTMLGIDTIKLIHLNDSKEKLGRRRDQHALIGHGALGMAALQRFVQHPLLNKVPVLMELPPLEESVIQSMLHMVRSW